ncbi:hypothetical protein C8R47DRAFT_1213762 [Mycena vitilis]|nr:hypothetical protein C8R47DRAFT_1213762 [Mycena vitilis]
MDEKPLLPVLLLPSFRPGLSDGEAIERAWAALPWSISQYAPERTWSEMNYDAGSTRQMGPGVRRDIIEDLDFNPWRRPLTRTCPKRSRSRKRLHVRAESFSAKRSRK